MQKVLFLILLILGQYSFGQETTDQQLAQYYYSNQEFDKASIYYEKVFNADPSKFNFNRYYECLLKTDQEKEAEKLLKKQAANHKTDYFYKVLLGEFYESNNESDKAQKQYKEIIHDLEDNPNLVTTIYEAFRDKGKYELAQQTLEKGRKILKSNYPLYIQFAEIYALQGKTELMIDEYLEYLSQQPFMLGQIELELSKKIDFTLEDSKPFLQLKEKLLVLAQKHPNETYYSEMLIWLFIQRKNFSGALAQAKAMDKRMNNDGINVLEIGRICIENKDYETARSAFKFILELGSTKIYYYAAENALLNTRFLEITTLRNYNSTEILQTVTEYQSVLERMGMKRNAVNTILELAHIQAFYANQSQDAITLLEQAIEIPGLTDIQRAEIKMSLADILVLSGDIWQASIYYMQIDKDFKFDPIGHEAKFKNARIFYYDGSFDYAQSQLSVLKESTSKLIANDAMQLSLLITDNFGIDSNYRSMTWFAQGDLLIEQHRYEEAFILFDSIISTFPASSLLDEVMIRKAKAMQLQGNWTKAVDYLHELLKYHGQDILADDALFQLATIYETQLKDPEKAAEYYKKILFEHKGSLYVIESRKRFRQLRGDAPESDL
jgi:tetratricopeptide (TPR) repeat protein